MRGLTGVLIALLVVVSAHAQYDSKGPIQSRFRPGAMWYFTGLRPALVEKPRKYDRLIFDVTYNDWVGEEGPFNNHWASMGLNTNLMFDIPLTKGNTVALGIGVAHHLTFIRHNGILAINDSTGSTTWKAANTSTFTSGSLGGNAFSVPVELRFRKESWRHFKFHIGGRVGYQANLFSRYVTETSNGRSVNKNIGFPDYSTLIYSSHVRIGLRNWALYGSYSFNRIFTHQQSSRLHLLQMGLSISLY